MYIWHLRNKIFKKLKIYKSKNVIKFKIIIIPLIPSYTTETISCGSHKKFYNKQSRGYCPLTSKRPIQPLRLVSQVKKFPFTKRFFPEKCPFFMKSVIFHYYCLFHYEGLLPLTIAIPTKVCSFCTITAYFSLESTLFNEKRTLFS